MADIVETLMGVPGAVAVARAPEGDAALPGPSAGAPAHLLYYRGTLDSAGLREIEGGRVVHRDLDAVEHWASEASEGRFEIDAVDGWLAGMPTYVLVGELATCEPIAGELPRPEFPAALRDSASRRWREVAALALETVEWLAPRGDVAGCCGLLAKAALATAQSRLAERGEWALTEARIVRRAGLGRSEAILAATGDRPLDLERAASRMRVALGARASSGVTQSP